MKLSTTLLALILIAVVAPSAHAFSQPDLGIVPYPRKIEIAEGRFSISKATRIVALDARLMDAADVLQSDINHVFRLKLTCLQNDTPTAGDIVLAFDSSLPKDGYSIEVDKTVFVKGSTYNGVVMGTATILQALESRHNKVSMPRISVTDAPEYPMRGVQMCVKHQAHSIDKLMQGVDLCRQYKLNVLSPHFSNYQIAWMLYADFRREPKIDKAPHQGGSVFSPDEIAELVEYARKRGVVVMPQFSPDRFAWRKHEAEYVNRIAPAVFGDQKLEVLRGEILKETQLDNPAYWEFVDDMLGRLARVFHTTPYLHVGAVDGEVGGWPRDSDRALQKKYGLRNGSDQWAWILKKLDAIVKSHGKKTMVYEGVRKGSAEYVELPKDVCFYAYNAWFFAADEIIEAGFPVLNVSWRPLYLTNRKYCPPEEIYAWNPMIANASRGDRRIDLPSPPVGALFATWEGNELGHLECMANRSAAMAEKCWNPATRRSYAQFEDALASVSSKLERIMYPMGPKIEGSHQKTRFMPQANPQIRHEGTLFYTDKMTFTFDPVDPNWKVYCLIQNTRGVRFPVRPGPSTPESTLCKETFVVDEQHPVIFRAQCFDSNGNKVGKEFVKTLVKNKVFLDVKGIVEEPDKEGRYPRVQQFHDEAIVELSHADGKSLWYKAYAPQDRGKSRNMKPSPVTGPIRIDRTMSFEVGTEGEQRVELRFTLRDDGYRSNVLTSDRMRLTADTINGTKDAELEVVVDGWAGDPSKHWFSRGKGQVTVELPVPANLDAIALFCWWGDGRSYFYTIETSVDGEQWAEVADMRKGTHKKPSTPQGYKHDFDAHPVKFIRVNMNGSTTNGFSHITEIRAYEKADEK